MSGLEALSLACNVMAVITFALDTAKVCRSIRETGTSDKNLKEHTGEIERTLNDIHRLLKQQPTAPTETEIHLRSLAAKCVEYNEAIQKEVEYTSPKDSTLRAVIGSTFKAMKRKSHIEKLKTRLEEAQKTMDTALGAQILDECMKSRALNRATYSALDQQHRDFLANFKLNQKNFEDIFAEFDATKEIQAYETLLRSLRYADMNERKNSIPQKHNNTFEWVFENTEDLASSTTDIAIAQSRHKKVHNSPPVTQPGLVEWLQQDVNCLYWVSGKPGSGKSTFMKFLLNDTRTIEALERWSQHRQCNVISHFLWKPGTEDQRSLKGLVCSLLHQILTNEKAIAIRLLGEISNLKHKRVMTDWDVHDMQELLLQVFNNCELSSSYLVLLDGLDELAEPHAGLSELFYLLNRLVVADTSKVKICVSSRPEHLFAVNFASSPSMRMQDLTRQDIFDYTADILKDLKLDPGNKLYDQIREEIWGKAEGVFLWVYVVLRDVKNGIEQYAESWDDIYDRILMLPPDLIELYKDMWSRLGSKNEKYIRKASRYFQYLRDESFRPTIAILALVGNERELEALARPSEVPCLDELNRMCELNFKTLSVVSAGLLEVKEYEGFYQFLDDPQSEAEREMLKWETTRVAFIHRTVIDFLDSGEGKDLFGSHTLKAEELFSLGIKAAITLRSATRYHRHPLYEIWKPLVEYMSSSFQKSKTESSNTANSSVRVIPDGDLSLIHQCATNKSRGLVQPPYSINCEKIFLFEASYYGLYGCVETWIEGSEVYDPPASNYALIGACCPPCHETKSKFFPSSHTDRYRMIRDQLKMCAQSDMGLCNPSTVWAPNDDIMLAWRCFLLHEISGLLRDREGNFYDKKAIVEILEAFVKAGVMAESPGPRYLIVLQYHDLKIVKNPADQQTDRGHKFLQPQRPAHRGARSIYMEVNDAFLLQLLSGQISGTSEVIKFQEKSAFMRPALISHDKEEAGRDVYEFFKVITDEEEQEASKTKDWIFGRSHLVFEEEDLASALNHFQVIELGKFSETVDALDKIGYPLSAVNKGYDCLHTWISHHLSAIRCIPALWSP